MSPKLEQQLAEIELIGNAEAELVAAETRTRHTYVQLLTPQQHEQRHRYQTLRKRYERETIRTRKLALVMLLLGPIGVVVYLTLGSLMPAVAALTILLVSGALIGTALPLLYFSNARLQELMES